MPEQNAGGRRSLDDILREVQGGATHAHAPGSEGSAGFVQSQNAESRVSPLSVLGIGGLIEVFDSLQMPDADKEVILRAVAQTAFRSLANLVHPDKPGGDAAAFMAINEAAQLINADTEAAMRDFRLLGSGLGSSGVSAFFDASSDRETIEKYQSKSRIEKAGLLYQTPYGVLFDLEDDQVAEVVIAPAASQDAPHLYVRETKGGNYATASADDEEALSLEPEIRLETEINAVNNSVVIKDGFFHIRSANQPGKITPATLKKYSAANQDLLVRAKRDMEQFFESGGARIISLADLSQIITEDHASSRTDPMLNAGKKITRTSDLVIYSASQQALMDRISISSRLRAAADRDIIVAKPMNRWSDDYHIGNIGTIYLQR